METTDLLRYHMEMLLNWILNPVSIIFFISFESPLGETSILVIEGDANVLEDLSVLIPWHKEDSVVGFLEVNLLLIIGCPFVR